TWWRCLPTCGVRHNTDGRRKSGSVQLPMTGRTPTSYQLLAAILSARAMGSAATSHASLRASFEKVISGGLYRTRDLEAGHDLLERSQLLIVDDQTSTPTDALLSLRNLPDDVAIELLLQEVLASDPPLWIYAAVGEEEVRWENIPDDDTQALERVIDDPDRREAILLALGRVVDESRMRALGSAGEEVVVEACRAHLVGRGRQDLAAHVERVSLRSDQLGYDITSPDTGGKRHRLEVKAHQGMPGSFEFFLSRNEATVGRRDTSWALVAVRKNLAGDLEVLGWCRASSIEGSLPTDGSPAGRWASVRISLSDAAFTPGLPLDVEVAQ
ncbi:MAG: protein NO VEIN domain-containing protein, partial [Pseudonocardiaceae bacterium]